MAPPRRPTARAASPSSNRFGAQAAARPALGKAAGKTTDLSGNRFGAQAPGAKPGSANAVRPGVKTPPAVEAAAQGARPIIKLPKGLEWYGRAAGIAFEIEADEDDSIVTVVKPNYAVLGATALAALLLIAGAGWGAASAWNALHPSAADQQAGQGSGSAADQGPLVAATQGPADDAPPHGPIPGDTPELESQMTAARLALKEVIPESHGLKYRDVETVVSAQDQTAVNFCGEVNARNPSGAYVGFQRFITSASGDAKVEQMMTPGDFDQAWQARCSGPVGPQIWL